MRRYQLTKNLFLDEYIDRDLYKKYHLRQHILIGLLDQRLIRSDQMLRDKFGATTINNWWHDGDRNWSGFRHKESPYYSRLSQHSFGRASDKIYNNASAEEVRNYIQHNYTELGITSIEGGVNWVHSDVRFWEGNNLLIFHP